MPPASGDAAGRPPAPVKVLHVSQSTGGVETSIILLLRHLDRWRLDLTLACSPGTSLAERAAALGIRVLPVPMVREVRPLTDLRAFLRLWRAMRRERFAIVHSHSAKAGVLGRAAAALAGVRVSLYTPHAFSYLSQRGAARRFFLAIERLFRPLTSAIVATSGSEARRAVEEVGFDREQVVLIPNSVDPDEAPAGQDASAQSGPVILTMGRLSYQKNPSMFVRVAALLAPLFPRAHFVLAGSGLGSPEERDIRDLVRRIGLDGRVGFVPWSAKPESLRRISECTVFVLTSRFEGMPHVVLEAMMLGRPVVATDVDGSRDLVEDGVTGFVVPVDADAAMASAVASLLDDPARAARMGAAAAARVRERYDPRQSAAALASLYESMLRRRTASP